MGFVDLDNMADENNFQSYSISETLILVKKILLRMKRKATMNRIELVS